MNDFTCSVRLACRDTFYLKQSRSAVVPNMLEQPCVRITASFRNSWIIASIWTLWISKAVNTSPMMACFSVEGSTHYGVTNVASHVGCPACAANCLKIPKPWKITADSAQPNKAVIIPSAPNQTI